ncbi:MAG: hypothetical protein U0R64_02050 [Candidatus Nanopelagicales bacterium]
MSARTESGPLVLGGGALSVAGVLTTIVAPLLADGLRAAGLDNAAIGAHLTALHIVQVVTILLLATTGLVARIDRRVAGLVGCALGAVGFVVAALTTDPVVLVAVMGAVGLGAGLAYSAGGSALSYTADPERAYAIVTIASIVIGSAVLVGTALAPLDDSRVTIFGGLALVLVVLGLIGTRIPALGSPRPEPAGSPGWLTAPGVALIAGYFLVNLGILGIWTFSGQMGQAAGLTETGSWWVLGVAQVMSVIGCVIAGRMGASPAKISILVLSVVSLAVGKIMIASTVLWAYLVGNLVTNLTFYTVIPFVFAAGADLNPRNGRLVVVVGASAMAAGAVAPLAAGLVAGDSGEWLPLGVAAAVVITASLPLLLYAMRAAWARRVSVA